MRRERTIGWRRVLVACLLTSPLLAAAGGASKINPKLATEATRAIDKALTFLAAAQQQDGGWTLFGQTDPALTSLAAKCFAQNPKYGPDHAIVRRALAFVLTFQQEDGGIYVADAGLGNYYTSVALMALSSAGEGRHAAAIERARDFLVKLQWDEEEGHNPQSAWYGGAGYGQRKRPDLSNTQMMLEALKQSGLPASHPSYKKALVFISRCQMSSHANDQGFARGADDGGFIYTPAGGGESKAGTVIVNGRPRLRSYGSMTYAGFKSLLYAEVRRDDPRVRQAYDWIRKHYTLDHNPNMPDAQSHEGLYYYYHVFARALAAWGEDWITDGRERKQNWREDLCRKLVTTASSDGSWVNSADRWYEGNPYLVTAYAVLALQTALR